MRYERETRCRKNGRNTRRRWLEDCAAAAAGGIAAVFLFTAMETMGMFPGGDAAVSPVAAEAQAAAGSQTAAAEAQAAAGSQAAAVNPAVSESQAAATNPAALQALPASEIRKLAEYQLEAAGKNDRSGTWQETGVQSRTEKQTVFQTTESDPEHPLIIVDPGHGGTDEGCYADGVLEKDINLEIAKRLREELVESGYRVILTRETDTYMTKEQRAEAANRYGADAFVSIHQNTYEEEEPTGIETWYDGTDPSRDSRRLALLIHEETVKRTGAKERELRGDAGFVVTGWTKMPACLIETGFLSSPEERGKLTQAEYQEKLAEGIAGGIDAFFHPKTMYLTFDDGPSAENTAAVLDVLKARNIKATFFLVGENVRKNPEVAKRIAAEGHTIGIHCNRHDYEQIYQSTASYLEDFNEAYKTVLEVTGVRVTLFRFPGGSINAYNKPVYQDIIKEMTARGFIYFDWNASLEDALKKSEPEELIANARETALGRKHVVMLAHDIVHSTALCLNDLIDQFPEYRMEPLTPEVTPVQFHP